MTSWILTLISCLFVAWSWAVAWGHISVRGGGEGADAMGKGLLIFFLGAIGVVVGIAALIVAQFTQASVVGKLAPLAPFLLLLAIWAHSSWWYRQAAQRQWEEAQGPPPWLLIDPDAERRAACAADVKALDPRHVVTEIDGVDAIAQLDEALIKSLKVIVIDSADVLLIDPDQRDTGKAATLRRINSMVPMLLLAPDDATAEAACTKLNQLGVFSICIIKATDAASLKNGPWSMTLPRYKPQI